MSGMREIERITTRYAETMNDLDLGGFHASCKSEVDDLMKQENVLHNPAKLRRLTDDLTATGVLPELAWRETEQLDANNDDKITRGELDHIIKNEDNYDPLTVLAAQYVRDNMSEISAHGEMHNSPDDYVTEDEVGNNSDLKKKNRVADPKKMFGSNWDFDLENNDGDAAADAAGEQKDAMNNAIAGSADGAVRDGAYQAGQPAYDGPDDAVKHDEYGGDCKDADKQRHRAGFTEHVHGKGTEGHMNNESDGEGGYNAEYNANGQRVMRPDSGDGVWQIAQKVCGEGASQDDVSREWVKILAANHFKKNHKLAENESVIIPDQDYE
ncbi:MAG TPA: hypothetical protein V6C76_14330 [Drouetiella sp.]